MLSITIKIVLISEILIEVTLFFIKKIYSLLQVDL